jgi:hypothetical protein
VRLSKGEDGSSVACDADTMMSLDMTGEVNVMFAMRVRAPEVWKHGACRRSRRDAGHERPMARRLGHAANHGDQAARLIHCLVCDNVGSVPVPPSQRGGSLPGTSADVVVADYPTRVAMSEKRAELLLRRARDRVAFDRIPDGPDLKSRFATALVEQDEPTDAVVLAKATEALRAVGYDGLDIQTIDDLYAVVRLAITWLRTET